MKHELLHLLGILLRLLLLWEGFVATMVLLVVLRELLRVVNACLIVSRRVYVPRLQVLRVDLRGLLAVICDLLVVAILKHHVVLVRLHELKLPETELVVADRQELWLDVFRLLEQVHQDVLRFVERILVIRRA